MESQTDKSISARMSGNRSLTHGIALAAFSFVLFLPLIGAGFVHDDFVWLYNVAYRPRWYGLTNSHQSFYTPLTWLTFKIDWTLWGLRPFPLALENLLLHILNTLLLYRLALRLWRSHVAAWWTAFGFALFHIANSWAVMWISARTHSLATFFFLAAMLATVRYVQVQRRRLIVAIVIIACCACSMLAKENGVTSIAAVAVVMCYVGGMRRLRDTWLSTTILAVALLTVLYIYLMLRVWAGAVPIGANDGWYHYSYEMGVLASNLKEYLSRTYLIAAILAGAIALSQLLRGIRPRLERLERREIIFSLMLFAVTLAPVILIRGRSGLYTYLPGIGAALLLGVTARELYADTEENKRPHTLKNLSPIIVVVFALGIATVGQSLKWRRMGRTNSIILTQIAQQETRPEPNTLISIKYAERDSRHRFPDGFGTWGFPFAVKLLYRDQSLNGEIVREGTTAGVVEGSRETIYLYRADEGNPKVIKGQ